MGKRSNNNKREKKGAEIAPEQVVVKEIKPKKWSLLAGKAERVIVFVGAVVALILGVSDLLDLGKTPLEKYEEATTDTGVLKTPAIVTYRRPEIRPDFSTGAVKDNYPLIKGILIKDIDRTGVYIGLGDIAEFVSARELYHGVVYYQNSASCTGSQLIFGLNQERLYVSTVFKDLQKEETIGFIEYNHWKIFRENRLLFKNTDEKLEVKDKQNNIVFSINSGYTNNTKQPYVVVKGYFINPKSILVLNSNVYRKDSVGVATCISKDLIDWKEKALVVINKIESIF